MFTLLLSLIVCATPDSKDGAPGLDTAPVWGIPARPANPDCLAVARPTAVGAEVSLERIVPNASFNQATAAVWIQPGAFVIAEKGGVIWAVDEDESASPRVFVDLSDRVYAEGERGLLGIAPHPTRADEWFVSYTGVVDSQLTSFVSRLRSKDGGLSLEASGEEVILQLEQPAKNHNGGRIGFDHEGMLRIAFGDGGDDAWTAQDPQVWYGKILRVDVDGGSPYSIPVDNPWPDGVGGAPEVWAMGLRNPWGWSLDRLTGEMWVGDVGGAKEEEVSRVARGGNYGWPIYEGSYCGRSEEECADPALIPPLHAYAHDADPRSVVGGVVYRGSAIQNLAGAYLLSDFMVPTLQALRQDAETGAWVASALIPSLDSRTATFVEDGDGEVILVEYASEGGLWRLVPAGEAAETRFPTRLSETGCVGPGGEVSAGLIPYGVNAPFWSDDAEKGRWFGIPDGEQLTFDATGRAALPIGSVVVKHFWAEDRLVETRLMMRHDDGGWAGYSYAWEDDGEDAIFAPAGAEVHGWLIPDPASCLTCHTASAGRVLGLELSQLQGAFEYPNGVEGDQLETWLHAGIIPTAPTPIVSPLVDPAAEGDVEDRARSWLHTNCGGCHRPGEQGRVSLDLRWGVPLAETGACDVAPSAGSLGVDDARVIAPGDPARSVLIARIADTGAARMPPVGVTAVDEEGLLLITAWVEGLVGCE